MFFDVTEAYETMTRLFTVSGTCGQKIIGRYTRGLGSLTEINLGPLSRPGRSVKGIGPKIQRLFSSPAPLVFLGKAHFLYSFTAERGGPEQWFLLVVNPRYFVNDILSSNNESQ